MEAIMREDEHHLEKHAKILKMIREQDIKIVFLGDSLTRRWEDNEELWNSFFAGLGAANFGLGADRLENIKWRILNGELNDIQPEQLILLAGTNNLPTQEAQTVFLGICELIELISKKLSDTTLLVMGLFPRSPDENGTVFDEKIRTVNKKLSEYCVDNSIQYADFGSLFLDNDGSINRKVMEDGLHLNAQGYKLLGPQLLSWIKQERTRAV